ncbi:hypothetical protein BG004_002971 [Podila humilis]|nr:hypothetical protein BG004_002971 [Podila humilis]
MASSSSQRPDSPASSTMLSPDSHLQVPKSSTLGSSASSLLEGVSGSASTISDDAVSVSSLGGLNHVNDGADGSTAQRRMSRVFSPSDLPGPRRISVDIQRRTSLSLHSPRLQDDDAEVTESSWKPWLRKRVPAFAWLVSPGYNFQDLPDDLIAGITISTVVIPQSMAYAMLAPLPPVYGLYTSVVPILIYCVFGTSRHMHTGTFAITTLLLGQAVRGLIATQDQLPFNNTLGLADTLLYQTEPPPLPENGVGDQRFIGMVLMLSFIVGCVQIIMSFLRVGGWASKHLLPDALVGGFNTAAVFHIGTSQLKHFLGIKNVPSPQGAFALLKSWIWFGAHLSDSNWYTVGLGTVAISLMLGMRKFERARKSKYDLDLRTKEYVQTLQRQAVSIRIPRDHAVGQRQENQNRGKNQLSVSQPYGISSLNTAATTSNISLRTVDEPGGSSPPSETSPTDEANTGLPKDPEVALLPPHRDDDDAYLSAKPIERPVYIPIPDILLVVIFLTVVNVIFSFDKPQADGGMGIDVIGTIPKGLPGLAFPPSLIVDGGAKEWMTTEFFVRIILPMIQPALLIAVIIYVMSFSIAKQFAKKYGYKVDANQEMFALGMASVGGSFFSGYACTVIGDADHRAFEALEDWAAKVLLDLEYYFYRRISYQRRAGHSDWYSRRFDRISVWLDN